MRTLNAMEVSFVSGGSNDDERRLPTVVVPGTRIPSRTRLQLRWDSWSPFPWTGMVDIGGIGQGSNGAASEIAGTTLTDINGNTITIEDQNPDPDIAKNSLEGLTMADGSLDSPFTSEQTWEGQDAFGAGGSPGADGIVDSLNQAIDQGVLIVAPSAGV